MNRVATMLVCVLAWITPSARAYYGAVTAVSSPVTVHSASAATPESKTDGTSDEPAEHAQVGSPGSQQPTSPTHHRHWIGYVIIVAAVFGLAIALAAAAK